MVGPHVRLVQDLHAGAFEKPAQVFQIHRSDGPPIGLHAETFEDLGRYRADLRLSRQRHQPAEFLRRPLVADRERQILDSVTMDQQRLLERFADVGFQIDTD